MRVQSENDVHTALMTIPSLRAADMPRPDDELQLDTTREHVVQLLAVAAPNPTPDVLGCIIFTES